jgi:cell division protease FtsH
MPEGDGRKPEKPTPPNLKMPPRGIMSWMLFLALALMLVVLLGKGINNPAQIDIVQFEKYLNAGEIEQVTIQESTITGRRKRTDADPKDANLEFEVKFPPHAVDSDYILKVGERLPDGRLTYEPPNPLVNVLIMLLPWLLIFLFLWFVVFRQLRNAGAGGGVLGNFGRSKHRITSKEHTNVTFADVAGISEAKEEVAEIIEFLKNPKKFQRLGGRIPRGVLLVGPPGCGKTLLAKAIAGEADVPFFSISGSDFVEMFVGVGASRVRDLFKQAKDNSPCIIFLDEIDAVGRRRGANFTGGGHDEREQTLNAILVEMDGFETNDQVIVIAATNRVDVLDPALIRPGRFDRQVAVSLPDLQGRYEILKVHARKVKLGPNVDLRRLARGTPMFSGADLSAIINESALLATMGNKDYVEQEDLEEARDKVRWGRARKSRQVDKQDREVTAYHEAGHALVQALEKHADPVHKVSIIPRGPMGGATFSLPERDRLVVTRQYLLALIRVALGGRIAEEMFCGDVSSGAAGDIRQATEIARRMVKEWGMDEEVGFVFLGGEEAGNSFWELPGGRDYSDRTAEVIDNRTKQILDQAYRETCTLISDNREKLEVLAKALMDHETLTGEEVNALLRGESIDRPTVGDLLDEEAAGPKDIGTARPIKAPPEPETDMGGGTLPQPG